jgi:hypothetical protein
MEDNAVWSWHIWVTEDDPAADPDVFGGVEVMKRNLGAFSPSEASSSEGLSPEDIWRAYGLFYQWGRKEPFVGPGEWNTTPPYKNTQQPLFDANGRYFEHTFVVSSAETGTIEYSGAHPSCFIAGAKESEFDWLFAARDNGLWSAPTGQSGSGSGSAGGAKSVYDPCPAGWRVAPASVWSAFTSGTPEDYDFGWNFAADGGETSFFPAAGRRSFSPGLASAARNYTNIVNDEQHPGVPEPEGYPVGFYWSSNAPAPATRAISPVTSPEASATALEFRHDYLDTSAPAPRASGFHVRCMKE